MKTHDDRHHLGRRAFLGTSASAIGLGLHPWWNTPAGAAEAGDKPNILLIMTDQQTASALSCTGNPWLSTPTMDALAADGLRFSNAYVPQPLCTPCRTCLQTARFPHETGVTTNGRKVEGDFPMLGNLVRDAGYHCAYVGKWHVGASFEDAGYDEASDFRPDDKKTEAAIQFLRRPHERPFFLTVSFMNPHNVCQLARGQELPDGPIGSPPEDPSSLPPLPPNFNIPPEEPEMIRVVQRSIPKHYPTADWNDLAWRLYLWGYYRLVEKVDAEIGRVMKALQESGQAENTVVVFVSDHGEGVAMHHWNQKQILYDQSTRVPLIVSGPGIPGGRVSDALVSTALDVSQTIIDFTGAERPASMRGLSLRALAESKTDSLDRSFVVAETVFAESRKGLGLEGRMLRTPKFKYCVYDRGQIREQLFDMESDPGETKNLARKAPFRETLDEHRSLLFGWAKETGDDAFPFVPLSSKDSAGGG